jgi:hypothetical protein
VVDILQSLLVGLFADEFLVNLVNHHRRQDIHAKQVVLSEFTMVCQGLESNDNQCTLYMNINESLHFVQRRWKCECSTNA